MSLYADAEYPVDAAIHDLHRDELASFARPGTWWSAPERTAIAAVARHARSESGTQESIGDEASCDAAPLPDAARTVARAVALGGNHIDRAFYEQALAEGLSDGQYVETVGIVARVAHLDVFARGIGVPSRALETPDRDATPSRERPSEAIDEGFFSPSIPSGRRGGAIGESLYGPGTAPNILRSLSLVPDEARRLIGIIEREYMTPEQIMDFTFSPHATLDRPQTELVAAKVSALNQCFY